MGVSKNQDRLSKKDWIEIIVSILVFIVILIGAFQARASFNQVEAINERNDYYQQQLFDFQYKPQILVEAISPRKGAWFTPSGYQEPNYLQLYDNDFSKSQTISGAFEETGDASFPLKIVFYNFGDIGTKIDSIQETNSCDSSSPSYWQMDIMDNRILLPQSSVEYNTYYRFVKFDRKPSNYTFCNYTLTFGFYNGYNITENYILHYNPLNNTFRGVEVDRYYQYVEERRAKRLNLTASL